MNISFIGGGLYARRYCEFFRNRYHFNIKGFYSNPISDCVDTAIKYNATLFTSVDDLCSASDVIFIAVPDNLIPSVVQTLTKLHIHNKIIAAASSDVYPFDIDNGYENTFIVIDSAIDFERCDIEDIKDIHIAVNGKGKDMDLFLKALSTSEINHSFVTREQLQLFRAATHMLYYGVNAVSKAAKTLYKISANKEIDFSHTIEDAAKGYVPEGNFYKGSNAARIKEYSEILESNGIDSITDLFKVIGEIERKSK